MFENFGENLTRKLGPFPVWVWGALIGGAFVAYYWYTNGFASAEDSGDVDTDSEGTGVGQSLAPSGDFSTVPVMPSEDPVVDEATNAEWRIQAMNAAKSLPGVSILAAQTAIEKYLSNTTMTAAEGAIMEKIIRAIGGPPESVGAPVVTPGETTPDAPDIDYTTVTTLYAPKTARYGSATTVRVKVSWKNTRGHTPGRPMSGRVLLKVGNQTYTLRLVGNQGVRVIGVRNSKDKRLAGNKLVISAQFVPWSTKYKTRPSQAAPVVITYK